MKQLNTFAISVLMIILASLAMSCGGSSVVVDNPEENSEERQVIGDAINLSDLPKLPFDENFKGFETDGKGASWLSHPNHLTPALSLLGGIDPGDPNCFLLQGLKENVPGANFKGPQIAYALYQVPLGATEVDLLDMKVAAQIGSATDKYYAAIANYSSWNWDFAGPLTDADWHTDMTSLGYDFTSPAGNMYVLLIALPGESLHITEITLNFNEREDPKDDDDDVDSVWNIFGTAYNDYSSLDPYGAKLVTFEDIDDGTVYSTSTAATGAWGLNIPSGRFIFNVQHSEMLLDVSGGATTHIDYLYDGGPIGLRMDIDNSGNVIYMDAAADWYGVDVPLPLITANGY